MFGDWFKNKEKKRSGYDVIVSWRVYLQVSTINFLLSSRHVRNIEPYLVFRIWLSICNPLTTWCDFVQSHLASYGDHLTANLINHHILELR